MGDKHYVLSIINSDGERCVIGHSDDIEYINTYIEQYSNPSKIICTELDTGSNPQLKKIIEGGGNYLCKTNTNMTKLRTFMEADRTLILNGYEEDSYVDVGLHLQSVLTTDFLDMLMAIGSYEDEFDFTREELHVLVEAVEQLVALDEYIDTATEEKIVFDSKALYNTHIESCDVEPF